MNKKIKVLITSRFDHGTLLQLKGNPDIEFIYQQKIEDLSEHFNDCKGLITRSSTKVNASLLKDMPNLDFVVTATSGFDHFDLKAMEENDVKAFHIPETQSVAAAEMTILMIMGACRKFALARKQLEKGVWDRQVLLGKQLSGQTLGIVGLGRVGKEVALRAQALGLKVQAHDPYIEEHSEDIPMLGFEELMRSSDIVSLHVPRTRKTQQMIKKETLDWMSSEAILVNMSRGDVIHEEDLVHYLMENKEFTAALDVFAREPLSKKSALLTLPNVILSPHVGASTIEALKASSMKSAEMACDFVAGKEISGQLPPKALWWGE